MADNERIRLRPWFVLRAHPRRERWARDNVERQAEQFGAECYLPMVSPTECLFPGYLFARTSTGAWSFLESTLGVSGILKQGDCPAVLRPEEMGYIRRLETRGGIVRLPNVFARGEEVRVEDGPFIGLTGLTDGMSARDRVWVLLEVMGRKTPVEFRVSQLERVPKRGGSG